MITENQERFVQMLNDPESAAGQAQAVGAGGVGGGAPGAEGSGYIQVTPEEKEAIERVSKIQHTLSNMYVLVVYERL
jgi:UV excision repair protein RAD23